MSTSPYRAVASPAFVWGSLIILLAFGSYIESCDGSPRVSSHVTLESAVDEGLLGSGILYVQQTVWMRMHQNNSQ